MLDFVFEGEQLQRLKEIELDMLKECIGVCDKLGIKYYLIGGTLLGAVRHKGFIPWDDDIDIAMNREDYEIFVENAHKYLPENLFVQTRKTDSDCLMNFAKIRNSDTAFIESTSKALKINHGVFIDIFPLDAFGGSKFFKKVFLFKKHCLRIAIEKGYNLERVKVSSPVKRFLNGILGLLMLGISPKSASEMREKLFTSCKNGDMLANHSGAWGVKEIVPSSWYGDGEFLEFEGISVRCPKDYKLWLEQVYGDYMKLPPEEKRVSHHYVEVIDLYKSYKEYV